MITQQTPKEQEKWLVKKGEELQQGEKEESSALLKQCRILYEVWSIWSSDNNSDGEVLSSEAKWRWHYDFYKWAKSYTRRRTDKEPSEVTIDNKITVWRDYIAEVIIEVPSVVYIPRRDEYGQLVDPTLAGDDAWTAIEPDFTQVDHGKLLRARGTARRGEMTPDAWTAVFDPYTSAAKLTEELSKIANKSPNPPSEDDFYLKEEDGIIYGCQNGKTKAVFQVLFENDEGDELFQRTVSHVLKAIGCHVPLSYQ